MEKFRVTIFFKDKTVYVSAKNAAEAKKKAYRKFDKKPASKIIDKGSTTVY